MRFFGLANEICGEDRLGWNRRLLMIAAAYEKRDGIPAGVAGYLANRYQYSEAAARRAPGRIEEILHALLTQLRTQHESGRRFLVGDALSALDLYWAAFAALIEPLPEDLCPMPGMLRATYTYDAGLRRGIADLLAHRDRIYRDHLELPVVG